MAQQQRQFQMEGNNGTNDTKMTKIFVGGLAWETQRDTMRRYFEQFGEIVEAVVITDKNTGRSKGYGFVCFFFFFYFSDKVEKSLLFFHFWNRFFFDCFTDWSTRWRLRKRKQRWELVRIRILWSMEEELIAISLVLVLRNLVLLLLQDMVFIFLTPLSLWNEMGTSLGSEKRYLFFFF